MPSCTPAPGLRAAVLRLQLRSRVRHREAKGPGSVPALATARSPFHQATVSGSRFCVQRLSPLHSEQLGLGGVTGSAVQPTLPLWEGCVSAQWASDAACSTLTRVFSGLFLVHCLPCPRPLTLATPRLGLRPSCPLRAETAGSSAGPRRVWRTPDEQLPRAKCLAVLLLSP